LWFICPFHSSDEAWLPLLLLLHSQEDQEAFRIERHNFRHKIDSIATMIESKQYDEVIEYLQKYHKTLDEIKVKRYTTNAVIDSILASYLQKSGK